MMIQSCLELRFLAAPFMKGRFVMLARLELILTLPDLLLDLFADEIDRRVKIAFGIFRKQVGARDGQADRAAEGTLGHFVMVVLQRDAGIDRKPVEVLQLLQSTQDVVLDGLGQRHIVRRENKFHEEMVAR